MVAYRCQSKKIKNNKNNKNIIKNEQKKNLIQKENPPNYYGLWVPNLIKKTFLFKKKKNTKLAWPYLKWAPSNLHIGKIFQKRKMRKSGHKKVLFGYFWARIFKNYCHIYYQHPQICVIATFFQKKTQILVQKCLVSVSFFWNFKKLLSYLKSAPLNFSICKISRENKNA